jgi:heme a synthase
MSAVTADIVSEQPQSPRAIRIWLTIVAAMIVAMVLVGGATRLTESGLSIVEWKPITGTLPPLSEAQWNDAFEAYKTIPQYREMNRGMSLSEFKTIFWWEWSHRLLGRVIGAVFLLPFLFFLARGMVPPNLRGRLWAMFVLGGLQGALGWWMVASGLTERVNVSQYRLAAHLILAIAIYALIVWTLRSIGERRVVHVLPRLRATAYVLIALTFVQIYFGALVAGLRAGLVYNTWPGIDGAFIPSLARLFFEEPWWRNFFDNALTVQFTHRMMAYALLAAVVLHLADVLRAGVVALRGLSAWLVAAVVLQAVLGILTLLYQVPIDIALGHQAGALLVLTLALVHAERMRVE